MCMPLPLHPPSTCVTLPARCAMPSVPLVQEMEAAGFPADNVSHTILLMSHEKVSARWAAELADAAAVGSSM